MPKAQRKCAGASLPKQLYQTVLGSQTTVRDISFQMIDLSIYIYIAYRQNPGSKTLAVERGDAQGRANFFTKKTKQSVLVFQSGWRQPTVEAVILVMTEETHVLLHLGYNVCKKLDGVCSAGTGKLPLQVLQETSYKISIYASFVWIGHRMYSMLITKYIQYIYMYY